MVIRQLLCLKRDTLRKRGNLKIKCNKFEAREGTL